MEALEAALDAALTDRRAAGYFDTAWLEPAETWSNAVWEAAARLGPLALGEGERLLAQRIAQEPVFVCGAPRSGTTLMRDLLDGHPMLSALPSEGRYFGNWEARLASDPAAATAIWTREWLQRLVNPMNQPPYWLLGRGGEPHIRFARAMLAWAEQPGASPLVTLALALATLHPAGTGQVRHWVDKTPGYETQLEAIWSAFPRARVIVMVRRPEAIAASYATGVARSGVKAAPTAAMLRNVARSHAATRRAAGRAPAGQLLPVSYEALVADRAGVMARVAAFLGVDWHDTLLRQSILGRDAEPNTSFYGMARTAFEPASLAERLWLLLARRRHRSLAAVLDEGERAVLEQEHAVAKG
jgi:hypothetical protein